jgi:cilia- and flagella-associated protein 57
MENAAQKQISIQPKSVFGLRTDIIGNIHFAITQEVIYPVSGVLSIQDCFKNKQKFLRFVI